jgi:hypothetical protein
VIECDVFASPEAGAAFRWVHLLSLKRSTVDRPVNKRRDVHERATGAPQAWDTNSDS